MEKNSRIIVITGASSGIGFTLACELAKDGNKVYAGARKEEDLKKLSKINNVTAINLDITKTEEITAAVQQLKEKEGVLDVLINNAGVTGWGPVMDRESSYLRNVMEINFFGQVEMIKAFYPLLRKSQRNPIIINISSQAGNYAMPFWSAYHSSKWALEAFSHCLRREFKIYGIRVAIVQPGAIKSNAFSKDEHNFDTYKEQVNSDFSTQAVPLLQAAFHHPGISKEKSPLLVVKAIRHAIYHKKNRIYYQPGRRFVPDFVMAMLPYAVVDKIFMHIFTK